MFMQHHNDTIIKTDARRKMQEDFINNILPLTLLQGFERVVQGFHVRGSWRPNINCNILTPLLWPSHCVFLVLLMLNQRPRAHCWMLDAGFLYCILSASSLDPLGRVWLSLQHLASSCLELYWQLPARRTQLNYIIVRCPLDLWNRMFNRHQAEITFMQFRGHSLPVRQSIRVSWDFFFTSSHLISQFPPTQFPLISAIRMCHFLPVHHLEWHFWPGQKVKI